MEHACVAAGLFPHPPIMLPEIGGDELRKIDATVRAVQAAARLIVSQKPETLVIMSPHNYVFPDGATLVEAPRLYGNLDAFGYPELAMDVRTDMDLAEEIFETVTPKTDVYRLDATWSDRFGHPLYVDQGTFVPLYYLRQAGFTGQVVLMAPRFDDYNSMSLLGDLVVQAAARLGRRIAIIASGDLSHRLLPGSPNGYTPKGAVFDKTVMEALQKQDPAILKTMSRSLIDEAGMCGLPSVYFLFGALRHFRPVMPVYSYEGPFGVGYGVALYLPEGQEKRAEKPAVADVRVRLARESISYYLTHHAFMSVPKDLPEDLQDKAGGFPPQGKPPARLHRHLPAHADEYCQRNHPQRRIGCDAGPAFLPGQPGRTERHRHFRRRPGPARSRSLASRPGPQEVRRHRHEPCPDGPLTA